MLKCNCLNILFFNSWTLVILYVFFFVFNLKNGYTSVKQNLENIFIKNNRELCVCTPKNEKTELINKLYKVETTLTIKSLKYAHKNNAFFDIKDLKKQIQKTLQSKDTFIDDYKINAMTIRIYNRVVDFLCYEMSYKEYLKLMNYENNTTKLFLKQANFKNLENNIDLKNYKNIIEQKLYKCKYVQNISDVSVNGMANRIIQRVYDLYLENSFFYNDLVKLDVTLKIELDLSRDEQHIREMELETLKESATTMKN
ncbi:hypothetical protein HEP_00139100 [Hepatocystis sp. ex Piliocolobus tephrosceles]|nr:hypothetical protein HEP_00139100 [Hepatocystis sp. ex Piliocolobus tephrosceles]